MPVGRLVLLKIVAETLAGQIARHGLKDDTQSQANVT